MISAPVQNNETERLAAVHSLAILDTQPEHRFDIITKAACERFKVPISTISIIDEKREWYKSCWGLDLREGGRDISFCGHAMYTDYIFIVEDTWQDPRFVDNPYVKGKPYIRFYAGVALREINTRLPVGVLCIKDNKPRKFTMDDISTLIELAKQAETELNKKI
jgi:GAF domain-containing protein